jgi:RimJ/RimL family protein N-acetyltransferase
LRQEEEVEDTSNDGGQDSEEEEEQQQQQQQQQQEEEGHYEGEARHYEDEVVGVTDLLQDPHPHADIELATSFALL